MSVFEILWDIAVSLLILRLAFFYYAATFLTGCVLGFIRIGVFVRSYHYGAPVAELIEMPFMLLATAFWAIFVVTKFEIPKVAWLRLAIGLLGLGFMIVTELVGRIILYGTSWPHSMSKMEILAKGAFSACLIIFGLMPWLLMLPANLNSRQGQTTLGQGDVQLDDKG